MRDTVGASDFWANKIRKEYRGVDTDEGKAHVQFCDALKGLVDDLAGYLKEHHLSGLSWNPHGSDFKEAVVGGSSGGDKAVPSKPTTAPAAAASGGGIFDELKKKQAGDSAATGLKKVTRDQQTWRKEYKKADDGEVPAPHQSTPASAASKPAVKAVKPLGPPKCEYQDRGCKWNVENQTKDNCDGGVCKVEVTDPKQQVRSILRFVPKSYPQSS